jgi:Tfp pilus assembly protein PilX
MKEHILSRLKTDERGQALLIALVFMLLGSLIVTPLLSHMATGLKTGKQVYEKRMDELYAADAGVEDALWQLQQTTSDKVPTAPGQPITYALADVNGKHVTVEISMQDSTRDTTTYRITSTATLNSSKTSIVSYVSITLSSGLLFNNAITTLGGDVNLGGGVSVISDPRAAQAANVFSGANLTMSNNSIIEGNATARGTITGGGTVTGIKTPNSDQSPGQLTQAQINAIVQGVKDETNISPFTPSGTPVSKLDVNNMGTASNYYHYTSAINVTGDITFSNTNYVIFDQQVYCAGNMSFKGTQNVIFNDAVYVGGSLTAGASAGRIDFNKPLTAGSIDGKGSCPVYFNDKVKVLGDLTTSSQCQVSFGGGIYVGGSLTLGGGGGINLKSDVYVGGDMTLSGGTEFINAKTDIGTKVVVQGATVKLDGSANVLTTEQLPFILAPTATALTLTGNAAVYAVVYAPQAAATKGGSTSLYGAVISKSLDFSGGSNITYPTYLSNRTDLPPVVGNGLPRVITWDINTQ